MCNPFKALIETKFGKLGIAHNLLLEFLIKSLTLSINVNFSLVTHSHICAEDDFSNHMAC